MQVNFTHKSIMIRAMVAIWIENRLGIRLTEQQIKDIIITHYGDKIYRYLLPGVTEEYFTPSQLIRIA